MKDGQFSLEINLYTTIAGCVIKMEKAYVKSGYTEELVQREMLDNASRNLQAQPPRRFSSKLTC